MSSDSAPDLVHDAIRRPSFPRNSPTTNWETYFPFDAPYPDQQRAIEETREPLEQGGFVTAELACGTGKTLFSLSRGIELVRDPTTKYKRMLCLTSVKQQLRAFEDDLKTINSNLDADVPPVSAVTLVGKADMCSLTDAGLIDAERIYSQCEDLRDSVRTAISNAPEGMVPETLEQLSEQARVDPMSDDQPVATQEWMSPYTDALPTTNDANYCAFYARRGLSTGFDSPSAFRVVTNRFYIAIYSLSQQISGVSDCWCRYRRNWAIHHLLRFRGVITSRFTTHPAVSDAQIMEDNETDVTPKENGHQTASKQGDQMDWTEIDSYHGQTPPNHDDEWSTTSVSRRFAHGEQEATVVESPTGEPVTLGEPH